MSAPALNLVAPAERRRDARQVATVTRASVRGHGETPSDAVVLDISVYGCRLRVATPPAPETRLWVRLDGGWPVRATVVWSDADRIGCRFDEPIANSIMREFTRLRPVQPSRHARSASA